MNPADDVALLLGVGDAREAVEEALLRLDHPQRLHEGERLADLFRLAFPHQPRVDVHRGELIADRLVRERRRHRGVDASG